MFGLVLIFGTAIGYKLIFRTKIRDLRSVDLQTGRRLLTNREIQELKGYERMPRWRKIYSFVQLW